MSWWIRVLNKKKEYFHCKKSTKSRFSHFFTSVSQLDKSGTLRHRSAKVILSKFLIFKFLILNICKFHEKFKMLIKSALNLTLPQKITDLKLKNDLKGLEWYECIIFTHRKVRKFGLDYGLFITT